MEDVITGEKTNYLNLKIGDIKQYSMIIREYDLPYWNSLDWKDYTDFEWTKVDEPTRLLCTLLKKRMETLVFNSPLALIDGGKDKLIGRTISGLNPNLGTYGLGSTGFFGLQLDNLEYLVYSVWYADHYILVNDRIVGCDVDCYSKMKPWMADFHDFKWDELTDFIAGSKILNYTLEDDSCTLIVEKKKIQSEIKFVKNDNKIPRRTGRHRNAYNSGKISDYLFFQHINATLIV